MPVRPIPNALHIVELARFPLSTRRSLVLTKNIQATHFKDKRFLRKSFGLYLAPSVIEKMVASNKPPELAIAVIVERGGPGSRAALPIARSMIETDLAQQRAANGAGG